MAKISASQIICEKCGKDLSLRIEGELIKISPCSECQEWSYQSGFEDGRDPEFKGGEED